MGTLATTGNRKGDPCTHSSCFRFYAVSQAILEELSKIPASNKAGYSTLDGRGVPRIRKLRATEIASDSFIEGE